MGTALSKANCKKLQKRPKVDPVRIKLERKGSSSFLEFVKDLNVLWKSSDPPKRSKFSCNILMKRLSFFVLLTNGKERTFENYFTVTSTKDKIEFAHGKRDESDQMLKWITPKDFEIQGLLGTGGFGSVFKAKRKTTGLVYALKVQPMESMAKAARSSGQKMEDETLVHMERTVLATCRGHPFIISLEYAFHDNFYAVLGLEYIPGGTLSQLISQSPERRLPFALCKTYAAEIVLALNFMHRKGIIYRDLKPSNILVSLDGHLKLTDFGLAGSMVKTGNNERKHSLTSHDSFSRQMDPSLVAEMARTRPDEPTANTDEIVSESSVEEEVSDSSCTDDYNDDNFNEDAAKMRANVKWVRRRTVCGTAGYRPPEQVQERFLDYNSRNGYDERADWFSLGVCCYTMLTGRRPFPTKKELLMSDSQRKIMSTSRQNFPSQLDNDIMVKVMNDAEFQCLMFEVEYPSYFFCDPNARIFIEALLSRDPESRPRYNGIISHPWMNDVVFDSKEVMKREIPTWVTDYTYYQSLEDDEASRNLMARRGRVQTRRRTLSQCVDDLCSECYASQDPIYAENYELKWTTKARPKTLQLFRHWNFLSKDAIRVELNSLETNTSATKSEKSI